jgi:hypothetical protein
MFLQSKKIAYNSGAQNHEVDFIARQMHNLRNYSEKCAKALLATLRDEGPAEAFFDAIRTKEISRFTDYLIGTDTDTNKRPSPQVQ